MQLISQVLRFFLPWIGRIIIFMVSFILTSVISFWSGVPIIIERIANEWLDRADAARFPSEWDRQLFFTFKFLAFVMIVLGWVILSFITVWIVNLIF